MARLSRIGTYWALVATAGALTGCSIDSGADRDSRGATHGARYGAEHDVLAAVAAIKSGGRTERLGSRAVHLPVQELYPMTVFDYEFPAACEGLAFRVYEAGDTQILEYKYTAAEGTQLVIRDYIAGTNPFIGPGL